MSSHTFPFLGHSLCTANGPNQSRLHTRADAVCSSSEGSSADRKGKKRASSPSCNVDSPLNSSASSKKRKSVDGNAFRTYGLRSQDEDNHIAPPGEEESSSVLGKGKGKAADKKGKKKSTALKMSKRPTSVMTEPRSCGPRLTSADPKVERVADLRAKTTRQRKEIDVS